MTSKADTPRTSPSPETALVVLPTYNEAENLPLILEQVLAHGPDWHTLVVDDASPDGTGDLAEAWAARAPRVRVLRRTGARGLGLSYRDGLSLALRSGHGFVFTMDSDLSHPPEALPGMRELARRHGVSLGSRYVPGGAAVGFGLKRRLNSFVAIGLTRGVLGLRVRDASAGFRCFRRDALEAIEPHTLTGEGFSIMEELSYRVERAGYKWAEYPITFSPRQRGCSKVTFKQVADVLLMLAKLRCKGWRPQRGKVPRAAP